MNRYYEYRHVIGFEETNLVGNVYYANYLRWQGQCREMFLLEHAPEVLDDLLRDLQLFTLSADCEFLGELGAFDELSVRMQVSDLTQTQIGLAFDYVRLHDDGSQDLIAKGLQRVVCMQRDNGHVKPTRVPETLRRAAEGFRAAVSTPASAVQSNRGGRA